MINLPVDESYALDYLSILLVKVLENDTGDNRVIYKSCYDALEKEIGKKLMSKIMASNEFVELHQANKLTYQLVDKIRYGQDSKVSGKDVDDSNMKRYNCKQKLQKKFFKTKLTEKKS